MTYPILELLPCFMTELHTYYLVLLPVSYSHFIWKNDSAKKWTWNATYLGSFGTQPFRLHLVHIGKSIKQPFWRADGTQAEKSAKFGQNGLASPKRLFYWFSNIYEMKPEWSQEGDVSCSFLFMNHPFIWSVKGYFEVWIGNSS